MKMKTSVKLKFSILLVLLSAFSAFQVYAQTHKQAFILALSKTDHTLAILNATTLKVLAKVPVGPDPHEVIATDDGKFAYVSNTGSGRSTEINVIDLVAMKALTNIDTSPLVGPHGLTFANGSVWFSAEGSKAVGRINPVSNKLDWSMGTGEDRTHMVYVTKDGKNIYTTNVNAGTVSILKDTLLPAPPFPGAQPRKDWTHTTVKTARGSEGFDVTPNGKQLWTASADDGKVYAIDLVSKKQIFVIDAGAVGANRLVFTPDGSKALISSLRSGNLTVLDVKSRTVLKNINIGNGGAGILIDPDGSRAFIGCTPNNYVAVVDLTKLEVTSRLDVGGGPDGLAWAVQTN